MKTKTIGLLGGMSWESTRSYYNHLNIMIREKRGGLHSARVILNSVDFAPLEDLMSKGDWAGVEASLVEEAARIQAAGADCLLLCTNTMHKVASQIEDSLDIRFFHIADCLGDHLQRKGIKTIGLLGTRFTMIEDFYAARLMSRFGIETLTPEEDEIEAIDRIIFEELCIGVVKDDSRQVYLSAMNRLADRGAETIALACTEIEMLVTDEHTDLPLDDTTLIHAAVAAEWSLNS